MGKIYTKRKEKTMGVKPPRKGGEWILIKQSIPVAAFIQPFSIFYGIPDTTTMYFPGERTAFNHMRGHLNGDFEDEFSYSSLFRMDPTEAKKIIDRHNRGKKVEAKYKNFLEENPIELEYRMKIRTREGDITIETHEYTIVKDLSEYLDPVKDGHAFIKYLNVNEKLTGKVAEQIFYIRSRGISFVDAVMMTSARIQTQNAFFIEMHRRYVEQFCRDFEDVEVRREAFRKRMKNKNIKAKEHAKN